MVPDIGVLSLGVESTQLTVAADRSEATKAMDAVRASLKQNGVEEKDIAMTGFNIQTQQYYRGGAPRIIGYWVSNRVTVKVRQLDAFPKALDGAVAAGRDAVRVNGVSFAVDKPERYENEARDEAVADARTRAEQLVKGHGREARTRTLRQRVVRWWRPGADAGDGRRGRGYVGDADQPWRIRGHPHCEHRL